MFNKLIKLLGGFTQEEFTKQCEEFKNTFDTIPEDEIKVGDCVYFYYVSRIDYQTSRYHTGTVDTITSEETTDDVRKFYSVKCTDSKRFAYNLSLDIKEIALSKRKLRDKIVNSDRWTFLTYMEFHSIENMISRNEEKQDAQ